MGRNPSRGSTPNARKKGEGTPYAEGLDSGLQTGLVNRLEALQSEPLSPGEAGSEVGPVVAWRALEDLWLLLSHCVALTAKCTGDEFRVIVHRFRNEREGEGGALRSAVLDIQIYRWFAGGAQGS